MSGVRSGTRAEQLQTLRGRVRHQLDSARRRDDRTETRRLTTLLERIDTELRAEGFVVYQRPRPTAKRPGLTATDMTVRARLTRLGVTPRDVKLWAVDHGLLDAVHRGRVAAHLVDAYETHHHLSDLLATGYARRKDPT